MKILYFLSGISSPAGWGTEYIQNLIAALSKKGVSPTIISPVLQHSRGDWKRWTRQQKEKHGVRIIIINTPSWLKKMRILHFGIANVLSTWAAVKLLSKEKHDLVHEFSSVPLVLIRSLVLKLLFKTPTIFTLSVYNQTFLGKLGWLKLLDFAKYYVIPVKEITKLLVGAGVSSDKVVNIPPGVNLDPFKKRKKKKAFSFPRDKFILTYYGTLTKKKGVPDLIQAYISLEDQLRGKILLVLASIWRGSPDHQKIRNKILSLKKENIKLLEKYLDVSALIAASDAFVFPQRTAHGTTIPPISVIEALASGKPVIATDTIGNRGLDGVLLVPPGKPAKLAQAIKKAYDRDQHRAKTSFLVKFELSKVVGQYLKLYAKLTVV